MVIRAPSTWPAEYYAEQARRVITDWRIITTPEVAREAESLAQRGLARDPRHPELHFYIGTARSALALQAPDAAAKKELFAQSLAAYEQALALAPGDVRLVLCVGESLDALERFDEAAALYERARKLDPKANTTRLAHAAHLRLRGRFDEAAPLYRQAHDLGAGPAAKAGLELIEEARKSAGHPAPAPQKP
jgi:tetratricopeptide (TPR) repeat protein